MERRIRIRRSPWEDDDGRDRASHRHRSRALQSAWTTRVLENAAPPNGDFSQHGAADQNPPMPMAKPMMGASALPIVTSWTRVLENAAPPSGDFSQHEAADQNPPMSMGSDDSARPHISSSIHGRGRNMEKGFEPPFFPQPPFQLSKCICLALANVDFMKFINADAFERSLINKSSKESR